MLNILYVFGGEKASGAEKVIERLITGNLLAVKPHLFVAPGDYALKLRADKQSLFPILLVKALKKLNRGNSSKFGFYFKALLNNLKISLLVIKYVYKHKINVVHANTVVPAFYLVPAIIFFKIFNRRIVFVWSDHDLKYFSDFDNKLAALAFSLYHKTLAVSNAVKKKYPESNKVETLYNGINLDEFKPDEVKAKQYRVELGYNTGQILIGMPATIESRKGQLELINAFKTLCKTYPDIQLLLAGTVSADDNIYAEAVLAVVEANKNIKYLGNVNDMPAFYNACNIIVNNSNTKGSEPLGTTIYEAMAIEKLVVVSSTGGSPEIVTNGADGFTFVADNGDDLVDKLGYVISNIDSLNEVRKAARKKVGEKFNISTMTKEYNRIIGRLISDKISNEKI